MRSCRMFQSLIDWEADPFEQANSNVEIPSFIKVRNDDGTLEPDVNLKLLLLLVNGD